MKPQNSHHTLDKKAAKKCGVNSALILWHFRFWIDQNITNNRNFHDGHYWTYQSMDALCQTFDYLTPNQIRTAVDKLVKDGYLLKGNYNKSSYNRTTWYAITEAGYAVFSDCDTTNAPAENPNSICEISQMETGNSTNGSGTNHKSIRGTDIDTDIDTDMDTNTYPPNPPEGGTGVDVPVSEKPNGKPEIPKIRYAEFVTMTEAEHQKLVERYGDAKTARMIEILDNYKGSKGVKYKSDYRACLSWAAERAEQEWQRYGKGGYYANESNRPCHDGGHAFGAEVPVGNAGERETSADERWGIQSTFQD